MILSASTIALIILVLTLILYVTEKLPLSVTTLLAMLAMVLTGILTPEQAFAGFSQPVILLLIALAILGEALVTSGLTRRFSKLLLRTTNVPLKFFVPFIFLLSSVISSVMNGLAVMAILFPILDAISKGNPKLKKKYTVLPAAFAAETGGTLTIIGSSSIITAVTMLKQSDYGVTLSFFAPLPVGLAVLVACTLAYFLFGQRLQEKWLDFEEAESAVQDTAQSEEGSTAKSVITGEVMLLCIAGFIAGGNIGVVGLLGALCVIVFRCVPKKRAYAAISWDTIFVVAGSIGFAKGIDVSGAGQLIADTIIHVAGPLLQTEYALCVILLVLATVMSNFMSNNACVTILIPICFALSASLGFNPIPLVLAITVGANICMATPICTACITMSAVVGYRFKDYFRIGGIMNVIATLVAAAALYVVYYL